MFFHFDVKFDYVLIRIWKKEEHFVIILFCKQSKFEIRIEKVGFSKFDFIRPKLLIQRLGGTVCAYFKVFTPPSSFSSHKIGIVWGVRHWLSWKVYFPGPGYTALFYQICNIYANLAPFPPLPVLKMLSLGQKIWL